MPIGILSMKFRIFRRPRIANPVKVIKITQAACALHNYLKISKMRCPVSARIYCPLGYIDQEDLHGNTLQEI